MSPLYLAVGLLNIWAQRSNFGINNNNTGMDIRVSRDIHEIDISSNNYNTDSVLEKREIALSYVHNSAPDTDYNKYKSENNTYVNLKNNHTSRKPGRHYNGLYVPHKRTRHPFNFTQNDSTTSRYRILYNTTDFRAETLRLNSNTPNENHQNNLVNRNSASKSVPGYVRTVQPIATTSKLWYRNLWSAFSGQKTSTSTPRNEIIRPKTQASCGVIAVLKKRKLIKIEACNMLECPAGYHHEQSFCVEDDHDYE